MPDKKISQLTSLAQGDIATTTDVLAIVDTSATETKKATPAAIVGAAAAAGLTNVDINSGAIDGTTIGANSAAAGTFTNLTASGTVSFSGATVSNGGSVTTVDINGGTIDGASVGASSASSGAFTTLSASGNVTLSGGTANGVLYLNGSKVATSGSALTFDGSNAVLIGSGGTGTNTAKITLSGSNATNYGAQIVGQRNGSSTWIFGDTSSILGGATTGFTSYIYGDNPFIWYNGGTSTEMMRLTSTGLGIGTSSPAQRITVNNTSGATTGGIRVYAADQAYSRISVDNLNGQAWHLVAGNPGASNSGFAIYDNTNSATRLYIDSSGNLGLGVTPSAWGTSVLKAFQVGAGSAFVAGRTDGFSNRQLFTGVNTYFNGTNWVYSESSLAASRYYQFDGQHIWDTAPSGTAGNAISFTQAMTLSADGSLGVGTTSPAAFPGYKVIDINGSTGGLLALSSNGTNKFQAYVNGSSTTLITVASEPLIFGTNNAERARITASGLFGVGTTSPSYRLDISEGGGTNAIVDAARFYADASAAAESRILFGTAANTVNAAIGSQTDSGSTSILKFYIDSAGGLVESARIDASGNLIVGGTTAGNTSSGRGNITISGSSNSILNLSTGSTVKGYLYNDGTDITLYADAVTKFSNNGSERARITAGGELCVGATATILSAKFASVAGASQNGGAFQTTASANNYSAIAASRNGNDGNVAEWWYGIGTQVGTVSVTSTATSYNTSSDRRLKENIASSDDAGLVIDAIQVVKHDWKTGGHTRYGMIAQDLHKVAPEAVKVGDDGEEVTNAWGVDYSKLVPMLVKEIQSLRARVAQLEAK